MKRSPILYVAGPVLLVAVAVLAVQWSRGTQPLPMRDYVEYWSAGKAFLDGRNPYDPVLLFELQKQADPQIELPVMMWNPPWAFAIVAPLGLVSPKAGHMLWLLAQLAAVLGSTAMLLAAYEVPRKLWIAGFVAVMLFTPFHLLMWYGQIGGFCLLGLAGFLYCTRRGLHLGAGAFAALTALKPHLLFAFGLMLVLDALVNRASRRAILGGGLAMLLAAFAAWLINPMVYAYYSESISKPSSELHFSVRDWAQPLMSYELRMALNPEKFSIQFVPTIVASAVLGLIWLRTRKPLDWAKHLPWLVLISVYCAAYGAWIFDLVVLIVPVIAAFGWYSKSERTGYLFLAIAYLALSGFSTFSPRITGTGMGLPLFIFFTPAILLLFAVAHCLRGSHHGR